MSAQEHTHKETEGGCDQLREDVAVPEFYSNAMRVHVGVHDVVIDLLREGPSRSGEGPEVVVAGRLRMPITASWTFAKMLLRVVERYSAEQAMFGLPEAHLSGLELLEDYRELVERARR